MPDPSIAPDDGHMIDDGEPEGPPAAGDVYLIANDRLEKGQYREAAELFAWTIELMPEMVLAHMGLGLAEAGQSRYDDYGFTVTGLQSPLFERSATPRLSGAKFRNIILQEVIQLLALSKEGRGRNSQRGRIS